MRTARGWTVVVGVVTAAVLSTAGVSAASAAPSPSVASAAANPAAKSRTLLGNDVSWPQCGTALPRNQAFAIVGLNGGLANNTNPCFATQLAWAAKSTGGTGQPRVALYVNTANPGHAGSWWPTSNVYGGRMIWNPYGTCAGAEDRACAYMYGFAKAYDNVHHRGVKYPSAYLWWLDVETINTWSSDKVANAASLEGMTAYYTSIGARVGLYSTGYQWSLIVGQVSPTSNLRGLPSWLAGANGVPGAKGMCSWPPLTPGGKVTMTQFVANDLDYDYSCI
ncbi:hypothetical protein ACFFGH_19470 [Lysobacter korlensis]|uniref:DUF1906 domain-containing protein n=1 Tax=Lysobacter korlensis TaxID=553636 RepID=A0ABV6RSQ9_9GAMM